MTSFSALADSVWSWIAARSRSDWGLAAGVAIVVLVFLWAAIEQDTFATHEPLPEVCALEKSAEACWQDRTGVPGLTEAEIVAGRTDLEHRIGDLIITEPGTIVRDLWIDGCISVRASNVLIERVLVRSDHGCGGGVDETGQALISTGANGGGGVTGLVVQDTEIDGMGVAGDTLGIGQTEYTCRRCDIHGVAKGAKADQNVVLEDSYLHHLSYDGVTHTENFFYNGGEGNIRVKRNWMKANDGFSTAAASLNNDWPGQNIIIEENYLEGGGGAGITGGAMGKRVPNMDHVVITNNALSPNNGYGGTTYGYGFDVDAPGNEWSGNYDSESKSLVPAPSALPPPADWSPPPRTP